MKKLVLLLATVIMLSVSGLAQVVESRIGGVSITKVKIPTQWYLRANIGAGFCKPDIYRFDDLKLSGPAFDLSGGFQRAFRNDKPWYWGARLGLSIASVSRKGYYSVYNWSNTDYYDVYGKFSSTPLGIHIGPAIGFHKLVTEKNAVDIHLIPEFLCNPTHDSKLKWSDGGDSDYSTYSTYQTCNMSLSLGVDLWLGKFILGVEYRQCFAVEDTDYLFDENYPSTVGVSIGYAF